jgi:polyhydroxybutyrate depolymerase
MLLAATSGASGAERHGEVIDGKLRTFQVHVPPQKLSRPPLLIALHPRPADGAAMEHISGLSSIADREGFIVVYPDGLDGSWDVENCCGRNNDVRFLKSLIRKLAEKHRVARDQIYLAGVSNGAEMTFRLADDLPNTFAALAAVAGTRKPEPLHAGAPHVPAAGDAATPMLIMLGTADAHYPTYWHGIANWKIRFGCTPVSADQPYSSVMRLRSFCGGRDFPLIEYLLHGQGHVWPGAARSGPLSWPDSPFQAAEKIWSFFAAQRLRAPNKSW